MIKELWARYLEDVLMTYFTLYPPTGIEEDWFESVLQKQRCSGITYKTYLMDRLLNIVSVGSQPSEFLMRF